MSRQSISDLSGPFTNIIIITYYLDDIFSTKEGTIYNPLIISFIHKRWQIFYAFPPIRQPVEIICKYVSHTKSTSRSIRY